MDAAAPSAKKRRSSAAESHGPGKLSAPALATTEAPSTYSTAEPEESPNQEPPPGAGGEEQDGVDHISGLPDAVLGDIVSLLSTKEAARTQTLASRWRHVWRAAPLNLDHDDLNLDDDLEDKALAGLVSHILAVHPGPGRRFCIPPHHLHYRPAAVDAWLQSSALDNLQELDFWEYPPYWYHLTFPPSPPPASTFRFTATLRVATFGKCHLLDSSVEALHFPQLRQLALEDVEISEGSLHTMISRCPALECLLLRSFGFCRIQISSNSLRSIGVGVGFWHNKPQLREVVIVDAPCLERLLYLQEPVDIHVSVISAPKLATLGCFPHHCKLVFGTTVIQGLRIDNLVTVVPNVKILAVSPSHINLDTVIDLMKCFPCLEKLYIQSCISGESNLWRRKHSHFIRSCNIRLKTIVLQSYRGIRSQVNFASFFVLNARELELMRLVVDHRDYNERFFVEQHGMLQMEKRAARGARLEFTKDMCRHGRIHVKHDDLPGGRGGLELLLESATKTHKVEVHLNDGEAKVTVRGLLSWVKANLINERPEMVVKGDSVYAFLS
ncbi:hypothetical protein ACP70R_039201 [Stipagrostis hirtigluma subsp. patula]